MMQGLKQERLDEIIGYRGEEARRLNESLSKTSPPDRSNYVCLTTDYRVPGFILHAGFIDNCAFYAEFDKTRIELTIKFGGQKDNRILARRTLAEIGNVPEIVIG